MSTRTGTICPLSTNPDGTTAESPEMRILAEPVVDAWVTSKTKRLQPGLHSSSPALPTLSPLLTRVDTEGDPAKVSPARSVISIRMGAVSAPVEFSSISMLPRLTLALPAAGTVRSGTDWAKVVVEPAPAQPGTGVADGSVPAVRQ